MCQQVGARPDPTSSGFTMGEHIFQKLELLSLATGVQFQFPNTFSDPSVQVRTHVDRWKTTNPQARIWIHRKKYRSVSPSLPRGVGMGSHITTGILPSLTNHHSLYNIVDVCKCLHTSVFYYYFVLLIRLYSLPPARERAHDEYPSFGKEILSSFFVGNKGHQ
jgi:hypothetical protein